MKTSKHTPGPWAASKVQVGSLTYWVIEERQYNGFQICSTVNAEVTKDEANAQLMAAAPELLEALYEALLALENKGWSYENEASWRRIKNAISKAEGRGHE